MVEFEKAVFKAPCKTFRRTPVSARLVAFSIGAVCTFVTGGTLPTAEAATAPTVDAPIEQPLGPSDTLSTRKDSGLHLYKDLRAEFKQKIEVDVQPPQNTDTNYRFRGLVGLAYRVNKTLRLGVRLPYFSSTNDRNYDQASPHIEDVYLNAVYRPNLAPGWFNDFSLNGRLYFPTGEDARYLSREQGSVFAHVSGTHALAERVNFRLHGEGQVYNQTTSWYLSQTSLKKPKKIANLSSTATEYGEFQWILSDALSFSQYFGYVHGWYMSLPDRLKRSHEAYLETAVEYVFRETFTVALSYLNLADTHGPDHAYSPYRQDECLWVLQLQASL